MRKMARIPKNEVLQMFQSLRMTGVCDFGTNPCWFMQRLQKQPRILNQNPKIQSAYRNVTHAVFPKFLEIMQEFWAHNTDNFMFEFPEKNKTGEWKQTTIFPRVTVLLLGHVEGKLDKKDKDESHTSDFCFYGWVIVHVPMIPPDCPESDILRKEFHKLAKEKNAIANKWLKTKLDRLPFFDFVMFE